MTRKNKRRDEPPEEVDRASMALPSEPRERKTPKWPCEYTGCEGETIVDKTLGATQSRVDPNKVIIMRYRKCKRCGYRFLTREESISGKSSAS